MFKLVSVVAAGLALAGCGTITRGANEDVSIQVTPATAKITTTLGNVCTGSCLVKAPRNKSFVVTAEAPGYASQVVPVGVHATGAGTAGMAGNLVVGGLIGIGVDAATGAINDHFPNPVIIKLEPVAAPAKPARPSRRAPAKAAAPVS
ncbi:hypothetical protein SAMN02745157_1467 [Kaistia soli DSM 19436]|uniref:Translation initiation factor 2 n=1 Tax=Kaistia soli DSM 19436 TaxID=1122133 RepID=A0A1M4YAY3_9HYPH|nr:hypothetical protein [Kaistia soli]SHF02632.1 hypothetical protein SAMN02745157_1467 [Kaistia soli DSM 19436]